MDLSFLKNKDFYFWSLVYFSPLFVFLAHVYHFFTFSPLLLAAAWFLTLFSLSRQDESGPIFGLATLSFGLTRILQSIPFGRAIEILILVAVLPVIGVILALRRSEKKTL